MILKEIKIKIKYHIADWDNNVCEKIENNFLRLLKSQTKCTVLEQLSAPVCHLAPYTKYLRSTVGASFFLIFKVCLDALSMK